jgi:hypothetical protein
MNKEVLREMLSKWGSSIVCRGEIRRFTGGLISPKSLANLDSRGEGPAGAFRFGSKVAYPVAEVVSWLEMRARPMNDGRPSPRDREREARP